MLEIVNNSIIVGYLVLYVYCIFDWWNMSEDFRKLMDNLFWRLPIVGIVFSLILQHYSFVVIWILIFIVEFWDIDLFGGNSK
jgi:hypothetical protein